MMNKAGGGDGGATLPGSTVSQYQNRMVMMVSKNKHSDELMWSSTFLRAEAGVVYLQQCTKFI